MYQMTTEEKFAEEVDSFNDWMKDASGDGYAAEDLKECDNNAYELKVEIHLDSGLVVHLSNRSVESFLKGDYCGDEMCCKNGILELSFRDAEGRFHQVVVRAEHVTLIDGWSEHVDWKPYIEKANQSEE